MPVRRAAVLLATGVLAAACGSGGAPAQYGPDQAGSVPACTATAARALEHYVTLTSLPGPCRGLSRAHLNLALGRALYEVAGTGQHKAAWRRRAAAAGALLARLIQSLPRPAAAPRPVPPPPPAPASRWGTGLATLATWLLTMGIGAFMLVPWIRRRGLHPPRAAHRQLGPVVTLGHAGAAGAGLLAWIAYLITGWTGLGWLAVGILLAVIGFGMATLTVWTAQASRPGPRPPGPVPPGPVPPGPVPPGPVPPGPVPPGPVLWGGTPAPPRRTRGHLRIIIPIAHGLAASATILLALLTVVTAR
ncbi:MAG: hypothetical protein ACRDMI_16465 [Streptosporangiaceae bacterium]